MVWSKLTLIFLNIIKTLGKLVLAFKIRRYVSAPYYCTVAATSLSFGEFSPAGIVKKNFTVFE